MVYEKTIQKAAVVAGNMLRDNVSEQAIKLKLLIQFGIMGKTAEKIIHTYADATNEIDQSKTEQAD